MIPGDVPVPIPGDGVPGDGIVGDDLVGAEPADKRLVGDAADGDDDGGASRLGDLHGEVANPTAGTDDQNVLTGSEVMLIEELCDGDPGEDQRGGAWVSDAGLRATWSRGTRTSSAKEPRNGGTAPYTSSPTA